MSSRNKKTSKALYPHGMAAYPINWKQYVISEQKICIQFDDIQFKVRASEGKEGLKTNNWGTHELPIDTHGTQLHTLAVGIPIGLYPEVIKNIVKAVKEHDELHPNYSVLQEIKEILNDEF